MNKEKLIELAKKEFDLRMRKQMYLMGDACRGTYQEQQQRAVDFAIVCAEHMESKKILDSAILGERDETNRDAISKTDS